MLRPALILTYSERGRVVLFARSGMVPVGDTALGDVTFVVAVDIAVDAAIPPPVQNGRAVLQLEIPCIIFRVIQQCAHLLHKLIICVCKIVVEFSTKIGKNLHLLSSYLSFFHLSHARCCSLLRGSGSGVLMYSCGPKMTMPRSGSSRCAMIFAGILGTLLGSSTGTGHSGL